MNECKKLASNLEVNNHIDFLGFRKDIDLLLPICDIAVASSLREGLPVNIMEAMACGLPVVATENRGHSELVVNQINGFTVSTEDKHLFAERLVELYQSKELLTKLAEGSLALVKKYSLQQTTKELTEIYSSYMEEQNEAKSQHHRAYL